MKHNYKTTNQRKAQESHLEEGKTAKPTDNTKSFKPRKGKEKLKLKTPPRNKLTLTLSMQALSLGKIYHVSSLNHPVSKIVLPTLCTFSPPLAMNSSNKIREKHEMLCMRSKLGCFTRYTSKYLSNYTQPLCQDL
jgi:hypothetical protein